MKKSIKILCFVLIISLTFLSSSVNRYYAINTKNTAVYDGTIKNEYLALEVSSNNTIVINDLQNNKSFTNLFTFTETDNISKVSYKSIAKSDIVISTYYKPESAISKLENEYYSANANISFNETENGIKFNYNFKDIGISFDVLYSVSGNSFLASVLFDSIKETLDYGLMSITVLPGLTSGTVDDNGYLFVPDGSGALINFNNNYEGIYESSVYGEEINDFVQMKSSVTKDIRLPVFGAVINDVAILGVIDEGDALASIVASSKNEMNLYNYVVSKANIRYNSSTWMLSGQSKSQYEAYYKTNLIENLDRYTVKYYFLYGNDADYTGMATTYRKYLCKEKGLKKNTILPKFNVDLIGAIDTKANFMGFVYYKKTALTTYDGAKEILSDLKEKGIEDINARYLGWYNNGLTNNRVLKQVNLVKALGNKSDFDTLNQYATDNDITITYDLEFTKYYKGSRSLSIKSPYGEKKVCSYFMRSVYATDIVARSWYLLSPHYYNKFVNKSINSIDRFNIDNLSLSTLSNTNYSDFTRKRLYVMCDSAEIVENIFKDLSSKKVLSGENANAYVLPYLTKVYSAPIYSSGYKIFDAEIPFYQIALHGYLNLTIPDQYSSENRDINFLKAIEVGCELLYTGISESVGKIVDTDYDYLYGTDYQRWIEDAVEKYSIYHSLLKKIYDKVIVEHNEIEKDVFETVYENGISVIVNYNDYDVIVDGVTINKFGFYERASQ